MGVRSYVRHFRGAILGFSVLHCHGVFPSGNQQQQQQKPLQQQEEKVAKIHSSSKRKKQPKSSFSMGFRSYVRHFRGAILGLLRPSLPWCFPIRDWQQQQQQKPMQQQEVKVAKIHSSSKRKKQPKSSFSMGFRSYVRHFWGAILGLLRPSLPWCFPIWGPAAAAAKASAAAGVAKIHSSSKRKKQPKSSFSMGFRSYVRHFRGAILGLLRPSLPWCFPIRDQQQQQKPLQQQEEKVAKFIAAARGKSSQNHHFLLVSEVTLGIFGMQFWGFSVLHCLGVFPSGDQQQQQKPLQQQEEKVAKIHIHSSSKKKKQPKSSFSMGFRSYVRHFRGAILGLLRPSLPWCFPIRGPASSRSSSKSLSSARRKR